MNKNPLKTVLLQLTPSDDWTAHAACEGVLITGSPGSGKSSTFAQQAALRMLEENWGFLVLCHKVDEPERWLEYCEKTNRSKDVIRFSVDSGHSFDFLAYEWNRAGGRGAGDVETLLQLLTMLTGSAGGGGKEGRFWESANTKLMRHVIKLIGLSGQAPSIALMNDVIQSLPKREGEHKEDQFYNESVCGQLFRLINARQDSLSEEQWGDLAQTERFLIKTWPRLATETSSSIEMHWAALADQFLFDPFRRLFCSGKCTFVPEQTTHETPGKIVIVDFPTLEYGETGSVINRLMKVCFQRAWLRRDVKKYPMPVACFQDEFQTFLTPTASGATWDNQVQQVGRSARIANVYITQNLLNLAEVLGESQLGARSKAFCANIMLRVMHQQNDPVTNAYCAELVGKGYMILKSRNIGAQVSVGQSEHLENRIQPDSFSALVKPDLDNPDAEVILYQGGQPFKCSGANFHLRFFSRVI